MCSSQSGELTIRSWELKAYAQALASEFSLEAFFQAQLSITSSSAANGKSYWNFCNAHDLLNLLSIAAFLHCFFFCLPSYSFLPPIVWVSIHSIHMCRVDRCLDVGCGLVALVTSLLLRRLLSSSVPFFEITIPQSYQYNVLSQHFAIIYINRSSFFSSDFQPAHGRKDKVP